ncbi:hypothetical protein GCM10011505_01480 [Tistrella bauzanensis]|uniref:DUF1285 domain-containing protein n=1 Tax=Tistrella bauzanensis TaxID=657419 RepID=A0ABQ1I9M7_9PROT|nr:DUF1285 domain-containing protein [Tistrella bauzanensis]GGB23949.1 hypothetical protein GCM10011505_01480 [Tistrella bauzanensis]
MSANDGKGTAAGGGPAAGGTELAGRLGLGTPPAGGDGTAAAEGGPRRKGPFFCGDIDMRIARDGTWFYLGTPIGRHALVKLFSTVLHRDADGDYWLETPVEKCRIQVEDAAYIVTAMRVEGTGRDARIVFTTNVEAEVPLDDAHPLVLRPRPDSGDLAPYLTVGRGLEALLGRAVYYQLVDLADIRRHPDTGAEVLAVESAGMTHYLGSPEFEDDRIAAGAGR